MGNNVSEWFPVNVGLRQRCAMSPWLFNVYKDGVVREVMLGCLAKGWIAECEWWQVSDKPAVVCR